MNEEDFKPFIRAATALDPEFWEEFENYALRSALLNEFYVQLQKSDTPTAIARDIDGILTIVEELHRICERLIRITQRKKLGTSVLSNLELLEDGLKKNIQQPTASTPAVKKRRFLQKVTFHLGRERVHLKAALGMR